VPDERDNSEEAGSPPLLGRLNPLNRIVASRIVMWVLISAAGVTAIADLVKLRTEPRSVSHTLSPEQKEALKSALSVETPHYVRLAWVDQSADSSNFAFQITPILQDANWSVVASAVTYDVTAKTNRPFFGIHIYADGADNGDLARIRGAFSKAGIVFSPDRVWDCCGYPVRLPGHPATPTPAVTILVGIALVGTKPPELFWPFKAAG
jgi:hypothetical protein